MFDRWRKRYPPVVLETKRFRLETIRPLAFARASLSWTDDAEIMNSISLPAGGWTVRKWWSRIRRYRHKKAIALVIWPKEGHEPIGFQFATITGTNGATIGVVIGDRSWWGRDVVIETRRAFIDYLFDDIGVNRIAGFPSARNFPSIYNYQRLGFKLEGTLRRYVGDGHGGLTDCFVFGMLREEWDAQRKAGSGET
jgi:RimJ/RimL family protein N-acetyltransferase